jgi:hypothetical protein
VKTILAQNNLVEAKVFYESKIPNFDSRNWADVSIKAAIRLLSGLGRFKEKSHLSALSSPCSAKTIGYFAVSYFNYLKPTSAGDELAR